VVPEETAAEESARKMAAATPAEPPQPEAAPAEPAAPSVTAETPSEEAPAAPEQPVVVFKSVDYQDTEAGKGTVSIAGAGEPGARIFLFFDEEPLGEVSVGEDGTWAFETEKKIEKGEHNFRADRLDETGAVVGRASIGIIRLEEPKQEVAAAPEAAPAPSAAPGGEEPGEEMAATEGEPTTEGATRSQQPHATPGVHTVQQGDTLWDIAEEYYGGGWRYRAIVRENRGKIRNPHWIYPEQEFRLPASRWDQ
jgi:nucleoid-associated protein YgaU